MTKLKYRFTNDVLCKMLFVKYQDLLKRLVAQILRIRLEDIEEFIITNPEIPPEVAGEKFCRLDISMKVNGKRVSLEVQILDEGDYPERSLYYWAREYSSALGEGKEYSNLPRVIVISILGFKLFRCAEFHSEFKPLEVTRHTPLTDKQVLHYFELPKLPEISSADDELKLWLSLFKAKTEEELLKIKELGAPIMEQAIEAYRQITATNEFKEIERLRSRARHNEASALGHARRELNKKWEKTVAKKDAIHAKTVAEKDAVLAEKDALIAELRARLSEDK